MNTAIKGSAALSSAVIPSSASSVSMGEHASSGRTKRERPWQPPLYSPLTLNYMMSSLRTTLMQSQIRSMQPRVNCLPPLKVQRTTRSITPPNSIRSPPFGTMCSPGTSSPHHHHSSSNSNNHLGGDRP